MAVRNIDKGNISAGTSIASIDPSKLYIAACPISGSFTGIVQCSFNRIGNIVVATIGAFGGVVSTAGKSISIQLPVNYSPPYNSTFVATFQAYDSTGANLGPKPGYFWLNGNYLDCFLFDGTHWTPGTANQGSQNAVTLVYLSSVPVLTPRFVFSFFSFEYILSHTKI